MATIVFLGGSSCCTLLRRFRHAGTWVPVHMYANSAVENTRILAADTSSAEYPPEAVVSTYFFPFFEDQSSEGRHTVNPSLLGPVTKNL